MLERTPQLRRYLGIFAYDFPDDLSALTREFSNISFFMKFPQCISNIRPHSIPWKLLFRSSTDLFCCSGPT